MYCSTTWRQAGNRRMSLLANGHHGGACYLPQVDAILAAPLCNDVCAVASRLRCGLQALAPCLGAVGVLAQAILQLRQGVTNSLCSNNGGACIEVVMWLQWAITMGTPHHQHGMVNFDSGGLGSM